MLELLNSPERELFAGMLPGFVLKIFALQKNVTPYKFCLLLTFPF
ncbi:MAG TPA: hypothetical protein VF799_04870 [Geobacteraceae bacterium]